MDALIRYILLSTLSLSLAYLIYLLVFRKERNFKQRRFYLLSAVIFAALIPLGDFYIKITPPAKTTSTPIVQTIETSPKEFTTNRPTQNYIAPLPDLNQTVEKEKIQIDWMKIMLYLYFSITTLFLLRIFVQILILYFWTSKSKQIKQSFFTLILNSRYQNPFSFFKWIFIHNKTKRDSEFEKIIAHESIHVQQKHSVDALLFEFLCAIMWFNPLVWKMRNSIQLVHEYLADEGALNSGIDSLQYQTLLVNQVAEGNVISLSSHFSSSTVKKRMNMMINSKFYTKTKYKILAIVPVAVLLFLIIAGFNGFNEQKVMQRLLRKNAAISATFSRDEITELAKIRVLVDKMVQNKTNETDTKIAYEKYIQYLAESNTAAGISENINLPHDSLIQEIKNNPALLEIWRVKENSSTAFFELNNSGKIMDFILQLSVENAYYSEVLNGIEIAGDLSPANIGDFIKVPENYNWNSEAEKLYASVLLVILTNKTILLNAIELNNQAVKRLNQGELKPALALIDKAIKLDPTNQTFYRNKAVIFLRQKKYEKALEQFKYGLEIDSNIAEDWKISGMIYDFLENTNKAKQCYNKCISIYNVQLESTNKQIKFIAQLNKAAVLVLNNQENEGQLLFEKLKAEYPNDINVQHLINRKKQDYLNDLFGNHYTSQSNIAYKEDTQLRNTFEIYLKNQSEENAEAFYNALPRYAYPKQTVIDNLGPEIIEDIYKNVFTIGANAKKEKLNSIKLIFRLYTISDRRIDKEVQIILGQLITINPTLFLQELREHQNYCINNFPLEYFGSEFSSDDFDSKIAEIEKRIAAINRVDNAELVVIKYHCLKELNLFLKQLKNKSLLIVKNENDYSPAFLQEANYCPPDIKTFLLDSNKIVVNETEVYYFPDFIPIQKNIVLKGTNDELSVVLNFTRINQSSIDYHIEIIKRQTRNILDGHAHLSHLFYFGTEMCKDDKTGEVFDAEQFMDKKTRTLIKIGRGTNNDLRAQITGISDNHVILTSQTNCPTLRSKEISPAEINSQSEHNSAPNQAHCDCIDNEIFSKAGEPPLLKHKIGSKNIIVCGYQGYKARGTNVQLGEKLQDSSFYASGFHVFECSGEQTLELFQDGEYYMDLIKPFKDELKIVRLKNMPTGKSLKYELTPVISFRFIEKEGVLKEVHSFEFPVHQYDNEFLNHLKSEIEKMKTDPNGQGNYKENLINYNFIRAVKNPVKYAKTFKSLGTFDGSLGPIYRDLLWYYSIFEKSKGVELNSKKPITEIKRIGYLNETPVKQLFNVLQLKGFPDPEFLTQQTFVTFSSPFDSSVSRIRDWLSREDLEFLMSVLDSEQESKCLVSSFSSNLPQGAKATVGGLASLFLDAYRKDQPLPRGGIICPANDKVLEKEIKQWWAKGKDNLNKKAVGFSIYDPPINGLYELENKETGQIGGLFIYPVSNELLLFRLIVDQSKPLLKSGELTGEIKLADSKNGTFYYTKKIGSGDGTYTDQYKCQLKFIFGNNSVEIKTIEGKCGLGDDIFPDGVYTKKSNKKPQTLNKQLEIDNKLLPEIFQKTNRQFKVGDINVIIAQTKNNNYQRYSSHDFLCRGSVTTFKNNIPVDSLKFNDMEAVGDSYGLNFNKQAIGDLIIGTKFGDYNGRLLIVTKTGKIENYPGGPFFITKDKKLLISPWHSDLSGVTIYDVEKKKVVMQKELPVWLASDLFYFQDEYYARWENNEGINAIFKLDLDKFELVKSEKTLAEIKTGEKIENFNINCACD